MEKNTKLGQVFLDGQLASIFYGSIKDYFGKAPENFGYLPFKQKKLAKDLIGILESESDSIITNAIGDNLQNIIKKAEETYFYCYLLFAIAVLESQKGNLFLQGVFLEQLKQSIQDHKEVLKKSNSWGGDGFSNGQWEDLERLIRNGTGTFPYNFFPYD